MKFIKRYRQYPKGYVLKDGEVSEAQLALFQKRGVIERSESLREKYERITGKKAGNRKDETIEAELDELL